MRGNLELRQKVIKEIQTARDAEKEESKLWMIGVALGSAFRSAAASYRDKQMFDEANTAYCNALEMLESTLGKQHPATAGTLASMGATLIDAGNLDTAIDCFKRALSVEIDILGQHPSTAGTMSSLGAAYGHQDKYEDAIKMLEQALGIYECTVGRMHRDAATAICIMRTCYYYLHNLDMAEQLALEALDIYTKTLGPNHEETVEASKNLESIRKQKKGLERAEWL